MYTRTEGSTQLHAGNQKAGKETVKSTWAGVRGIQRLLNRPSTGSIAGNSMNSRPMIKAHFILQVAQDIFSEIVTVKRKVLRVENRGWENFVSEEPGSKCCWLYGHKVCRNSSDAIAQKLPQTTSKQMSTSVFQ